MIDRAKVNSEYRQLRVALNKPNPQKNERTEIRFLIEGPQRQGRLYAVMALRYKQRLQLSHQISGEAWSASGFSPFHNLEDFCAGFLNKHSDASRLQATSQLKEELDSLGVPRDGPF